MNPLLADDLFVGREPLLAQVSGLLGQGRSALLIGGRRAGKSTLTQRLAAGAVGRRVIRADAAGWDLATEEAALGALRGAAEGRSETEYPAASRNDLLGALEAAAPAALVIDEADRLLQPRWGPGFFSFLRWLDDTQLRRRLSLLLVGGPALVLFKDPEDRGSPPLNTAEQRYVEPLDLSAVRELAGLAGDGAWAEPVMALAGGQAWLTTRLLAEVHDGRDLDDAADAVFERAVSTFEAWRHQLGPAGRALLAGFPPDGVVVADLRRPPWSRHRSAMRLARCVGALRLDGDRLRPAPRLFLDWLADQDQGAAWDVALCYAPDDEPLAAELYERLRGRLRVFFAPRVTVDAWGTDDVRVLPNLYGAPSRRVLVLSTRHYVARHWTRHEYDTAERRQPGRIVLLDLGRLPDDRPPGLPCHDTSPAGLAAAVA